MLYMHAGAGVHEAPEAVKSPRLQARRMFASGIPLQSPAGTSLRMGICIRHAPGGAARCEPGYVQTCVLLNPMRNKSVLRANEHRRPPVLISCV
jgi:hypothetical protein